MILAMFCSLALAEAPDYRGARVRTDFSKPRTASVVVGLGGSWIFGGNAAGYGGGVAERLSADLALGKTTALTLDLDHARHSLRDAAAYFPEGGAPAEAATGFRDYTALDLGLRVGFDLSDPSRRDAPALTAVPFTRLGFGVAFTTTLLDAPSFDGRLALRSNAALPAPSLGGGVELRVRRWISVLPHVKAQVVVATDASELDGRDRLGLEWRVQPALDASFNF